MDKEIREKIAKQQKRAAEERDVRVDFPDEPGPIWLPKCSEQVSLAMVGGVVLLELETEDLFQRMFIPLPEAALRRLHVLLDNAINSLGVGEPRN